jgi:predicted metal-dependent enzyme (double-stranded beta helix superfamily)
MNTDASGVLRSLELPSDRTLERHELQRLVCALAERRELWEAYDDPHATERTYMCLHRDAHLDVWAIFWRPENDTGWHDHDTSSGAVHVIEGALEEHALLVAAPERRTGYGPGAAFTFGPSHNHRLTCAGSRAASIHAYSPPLWRLGQYTVDPEGALHRLSVSYADELRPLEPGALPAAA